MLSHVHIKNLGIIDEITIHFEKGLNILTGETGAGKSLIINAIHMILGNKMSKDFIRTGADKAVAEALFFIENDVLKSRLAALGYEEDEIVIYRELLLNGRSVTKVNGRLVTLGELRALGELLIDLHGQHDNQSLLNPKNHLELLDNFAGKELTKRLLEYKEFYEKRRKIKEKMEQLGGEPEKRIRSMEFLKFQIEEIEEASLSVGEEEELIRKRNLFMNSEKIMRVLGACHEGLSGDSGVLSRLEKMMSGLREISTVEEKYQEYEEKVSEIYYLAEDISSVLGRESEKVFVDESEMNVVTDRLDLIFKLKKKYGADIETILKTLKEFHAEYEELLSSEEILTQLMRELEETEKKMRECGKVLSELRQKAGKKLETGLTEILTELEMPKSRFEISIRSSDHFGENGMDSVEFLFSSNLGESVKPLAKIASGGEISRIMLSLKNVLLNADIIPVMVFDEIDVGISGKAGFAVAEKMHEIAKDKQVICVTHLASIAAYADCHFYISKQDEDGRTVTRLKRLLPEERVQEVARIISGGNITEASLAHAKELIALH
ncbi:MAG: DNA repair protein RecN [Clostridia bacterium]|nr:DNA repair protein RecN [Clostridia bacterium]